MIVCRLNYDAMQLAHLIDILQPLRTAGPEAAALTGVTASSRQVRRGYVFVALRGTRGHGLDHLPEALQRGAAAVVAEEEVALPRGVAFLRVADARRALGRIAAAFFHNPAQYLRMVGVTGTNGKTTIGFLLRDLLREHGLNPGLIGTVQYEMGRRVIPADRTTPDATELQAMLDQMRQADCHAAVMEVSSHALDQHRTEGIDFDTAIFTNLTHDHLDYHRDMESYFQAKARLFTGLGAGDKESRAVINVDDPHGRRLVGMVPAGVPVITYGFAADAMVRAENARLTPAGNVFDLRTPWGDTRVETALLGRFNVSNMLAAAAAAGGMGMPLARIAAVLSRFTSAPGRLERVPSRRGHVFVDYAHTDHALENVLETLRELTRGRVIVVFGCGGDRDRAKRPKMGAVAARLADEVILTSDNPRGEDPLAILAEIRAGMPADHPVRVEPDREQAIATGVRALRDGDILLIAGKGHEPFQEVGRTLVEFDDRQVAAKHVQLAERSAP